MTDLLKICPARTIPTVTSQPQTLIDGVPTSPTPSLDCVQPDDLQMIEVYKAHNIERARFGYQPLRWNPALEATATTYANQLARTGQLAHASREGRGTERENVNQGMLGWNANLMMGNWLNERQYFTPGIFPNVSTTGDWYQVGHYSQMIWPQTTDIGCGMATGSGFQWLVCRYNPGGNKDGKPVGLPQMPSPRHIVGRTPTMPQPRQVVASNPPMPQLRQVVASTPPMPQLRGGVGQENPRPVLANQDGIAPATSTTPTGPPPPPPPPTARDDAPDGDEARHPLNGYFAEALARFATAVDCGDKAAAAAELVKMRYALDELKKRLKAAKKAGPYSAVKPDDVQKQIDDMETKIRTAEQRPGPGACPPMPQPRAAVSR